MHIEREANGAVAVVWVSTLNRVLELRELLDEDGLLPADVMETQACDARFIDRRTGERVMRTIPAPDATGRRDWAEYRQISDDFDDRLYLHHRVIESVCIAYDLYRVGNVQKAILNGKRLPPADSLFNVAPHSDLAPAKS